MKHIIRTAAFLAVLSVAAAGCQKEPMTGVETASCEAATMKTVTYTVDGEAYRIVVANDEEWHSFLDMMFALAEEGHNVSFRQGNAQERGTAKEVVTFTTTDQGEAYHWADQMSNQGYEVSITYDKKTGVYTCIAVK